MKTDVGTEIQEWLRSHKGEKEEGPAQTYNVELSKHMAFWETTGSRSLFACECVQMLWVLKGWDMGGDEVGGC